MFTKRFVFRNALGNLSTPCGVILGGVVPPGSPNPDPISDQKNVIFHTRLQTWPLKPQNPHPFSDTYIDGL